jgi:hypothetical protein
MTMPRWLASLDREHHESIVSGPALYYGTNAKKFIYQLPQSMLGRVFIVVCFAV